jgi:peptidyl-prolyl cis-trans isomerase B (cyclophilin B)
MVLELYYDKAPNTVRNFIYLANSGFYSGSTFHRVIEDFMIQGGIGSTTACIIKGEFSSNGFSGNDISHIRGVISMARTSVKNSATSQFFIVHKKSTFLDGEYAAFGMLISGFTTLDGIASVNTSSDKPVVDVVITSITVDTHGDTFDAPTCY